MNKKCQIFTPEEVVNDLLDVVGYKRNIYGKKVIDTACGDGNMLVVIVRKYILDAIDRCAKNEDIKTGLENDITGIEIDTEHFKKCIENLNVEASRHNIENVIWDIHNADSLKFKHECKYDYVIGNPPYINYRDLDLDTREFIRSNFESCSSGKFDYCYAFVENALDLLSDDGKGAFLIPNSVFKNVFGQKLRDRLSNHVVRIEDFSSIKLFDNAMTSSAFLIIERNPNSNFITYINRADSVENKILRNLLVGKWRFKHIESISVQKVRFGDLFKASITIATLYNKAFIIKEFDDLNDKYYSVNGLHLEKNLLRKAASPRALNYGKDELIIFPYYYEDGELRRYNNDEFENTYQGISKHLMKFSEKLAKRDIDNNVQMYEYGRTQALAHLNQEKLLISTVVTNCVKVYQVDKETIPYSGIYVVPISNYPLTCARKILESNSFQNYVKSIGINASGKSLRITPADINNFEFDWGGDLIEQNEI